MKVINRRKSPLTICALLCIYVMSASTVRGQEGGSGGGDDGKPRSALSIKAANWGSVDRWMFDIQGECWATKANSDGGALGDAGETTFMIRQGSRETLQVTPLEAIIDDDGTVSGRYSVCSDDLMFIDGSLVPCANPILVASGNIPERSFDVQTPSPEAIIEKPEGSATAVTETSWIGFSPYHFDFQAVEPLTPGYYDLTIEGMIEPPIMTLLGLQWELDPAAGLLTNETETQPAYLPLDLPDFRMFVDGKLTLTATFHDEPVGEADERMLRLYQDHLARDFDNFGTGIPCGDPNSDPGPWNFVYHGTNISMPYRWNCHGSTRHHYDGKGGGNVAGMDMQTWLDNNFVEKNSVTVDHQPGAGNGSHPDLGSLNRGDIIAYYLNSGTTLIHTQTCTGNGTETYGANNEPLSYPGQAELNESWRWATSPAGDWANDMYWPDWGTGGSDPTPVIIKVYRKPSP